MRDGTKHSSWSYASKRVKKLEARIATCELMNPQARLSDGRTAAERIKLDRVVLKKWNAVLEAAQHDR